MNTPNVQQTSSKAATRYRRKCFLILATVMAGLLLSITNLFAAPQPDIGSVVALKGKAEIERGGKKVEAKVKAGLQLTDQVQTGAGSRVKMLFIDDSVLTLADNSRMAIKEFVHSKGDRGKSIFNLLDGKMRAVVGKTRFEVQTPTAVAAARGTVIFFETGILDGRRFTRIVCLEGTVDVQGVGAFAGTSVPLAAGNQITITEGVQLPQPTAAPPAVIEQIRKESSMGTTEIRLATPQLPDNIASGILNVDVPYIVPMLEQQQPGAPRQQPTSVTIGVTLGGAPPLPTGSSGGTGGTSSGTTLN